MTSKFGNVDVLSGLPDIHQVDLDHSSNGLFGLTLTRRYIGMTANYSENNNGMTMFGPHWMSNLEMRLECYACPEGGLLTQGGSLSLRLDHGYAVAFHAGANGAYRADPGQMAGTILHLNNPDPALANWRLTVDGEDATIEFNGYGRLLSMRDRNSQGIDLIYNSSQRLERVQAVAPDDRYLDFTYSNTVTNDPSAWRLVRVTPSWTGNYVEYTYKSKVPNNLDRINVVLWQVKDKHGRVYHQFDWTKQDQLPTNPALMESRLPRYAAPNAEYMVHRVGGSTNNSLRVLQAYRFLVTYLFPRCIGVFDSAGTRISWEVSTGTDPLTDYEQFGNRHRWQNIRGERIIVSGGYSAHVFLPEKIDFFDMTGSSPRFVRRMNQSLRDSNSAIDNGSVLPERMPCPSDGQTAIIYCPEVVYQSSMSQGTSPHSYGSSRPTRVPVAGEPDREYFYDWRGRLTGIQQGTQRTSFTLDQKGNVTQVRNQLGQETIYTLDSLGRVETVSDALGMTRFVHNNRGKVVRIIDREGRSTFSNYDSRGLLISTGQGEQGTTTTY